MTDAHISVRDLTMAYGSRVIQRDLTFDINHGDIFVIMGGSGCGKSTLLKHLLGLIEPSQGDILYAGESFVHATPERRDSMRRGWGITYQSGGLFSAMSLAENIELPLQLYTDYSASDRADIIAYKLALVGLDGYQHFYPSEISGGMRKRAALARAIALEPDILFFDEPSAGLDPISSSLLDELIQQLQASIGATVVMVTHELPSIFSIATNSVYLDADSKTMIAYGDPKHLRDHSDQAIVRQFLTRTASHPAKEHT
ncbi:ATP-binding cassette domain-containing protein [Aestuariicella hydrocarbonica]|uniref:ATP-binding cassette domain-containing protein n=1 Tax=Pseudomaricurvus hydrocarbonicus TaxID=1470433 RepID=A0A9E5MPZ6_9GAMM|nr:ATP-binding cassette domain-containing protein [Aestuariicella hydrocarbonica]NHO68285.1 ATP-binding cassette domain-containing protein [Aestuariicella hydrocarbonica]